MLTKVFEDPQDVDLRLSELGLDLETLVNVVLQGQYAFASCTANDPPLFPGIFAWAQMVRACREYLMPRGWTRSNDNNYCIVVNATNDVAVAIATGDEGTGDPNMTPTTRSAKGPRTAEAIAANQLQLELPLDFDPIPSPLESHGKRMTWVLLVHRRAEGIRSELSLPLAIGDNGFIDAWMERIILGEIPTDPASKRFEPAPSDQPDIAIEIKRRA